MINVKKAYCLDENLIFPKCYICKNELSPYFISEDELLSLGDETLQQLYLTDLLIKYENKNIIYLCTTCISHKKT